MEPKKRRTFVFITDIPEFLLKPINGISLRDTRDPRYERLRLLLADHTAGLMAVMHLETRPYALALYASEEEATAACRTTIVPESVERDYPPLTLRIIEKEKPLPPEAVYNPKLLIEGEEVAKEDLADTRGLELVYRGRRIPKWCSCTRDKTDCAYGMACNAIHLKAYQKTVRKRPRVHDNDDDGASPQLSIAEAQRVHSVVSNKKAMQSEMAPCPSSSSMAATTPSSSASSPLLALPTIYIPVTEQELLREIDSPAASAAAGTPSTSDLARRIQDALASYTEGNTSLWPADWATKGPFFMKLSCPGGAPWDWALYDETPDAQHAANTGLARLKQLCPYPANGIATPLQRDLFAQKLLYALNQLNRFSSVEEGLHALRCGYTPHLRDALAAYRESIDAVARHHRAKTEKAVEMDEKAESGAPLFVCVQPWLYLPTAGCEVEVFTEEGGRHIRGVLQRRGALRLMTSAALLHARLKQPAPSALPSTFPEATVTALRQLDRFAILENEVDVEAEKCLTKELAEFGRLFVRAANEWSRRVEAASPKPKHSTDEGAISPGGGGEEVVATGPPASEEPLSSLLPAGAAWCARLALVLSPPPHDGTEADVTCRGVVLLSLTDYRRAIEECVLFSFLRPSAATGPSAAPAASAVPQSGLQVGWNTQKHPFVPLFSIELLTRLRNA